jgi:antitoxin VapB
MALNIKNPEAHKIATELARLRGVSASQAVLDAVRNDLEREKKLRREVVLASELVEIGKRCAAHVQGPVDLDELLYDEHGLPK